MFGQNWNFRPDFDFRKIFSSMKSKGKMCFTKFSICHFWTTKYYY